MTIKIYSDTNKGVIFFDETTVEPKTIGTIDAIAHPTNSDAIIIRRTDRVESDGVTFRTLFSELHYDEVCDVNFNNLASNGVDRQGVIDYINEQATDYQEITPIYLNTDVSADFRLDPTSTTILEGTGHVYPVNSLTALQENGMIKINSSIGGATHFAGLDHRLVTIAGVPQTGGLSDVVNKLNELFTVGAFECVIIGDPYATMVADVGGENTTCTTVGLIDPSGPDIYAGTGSSNNGQGLSTAETIDQAGEYFTFDIRVPSTMTFGLIDINDTTGIGNNTLFLNNSGGRGDGLKFAHSFHVGNKGPWTYAGELTANIDTGWSGVNAFVTSQNGIDFANQDPVKLRVGINANAYLHLDYWDSYNSEWHTITRSNSVSIEGDTYKLGIKIHDNKGRIFSLPKIHLLDPVAPTMYYRYIQSPDGRYTFPLFSSTDEAIYYDGTLSSGTGTFTEYTFDDDPSGKTWYLPTTGSNLETNVPSIYNPMLSSTDPIYTEISSLTNADLAPPLFIGSNYIRQEGDVMNIQINPTGMLSYSTSLSIYPTGSGLVWDGVSLLYGTLSDVNETTTYTVVVTRGNSYGSRTGQFTIQVQDVPVVQPLLTSWNKALAFDGYNDFCIGNAGSAIGSPIRRATPATQSATGKTAQIGQPWMVTIAYTQTGASNDAQALWRQGDDSTGTNTGQFYLRLSDDRKLRFRVGTNFNRLDWTSADSFNDSDLHMITVVYRGGQTGVASGFVNNYYNEFMFYKTNPVTGITTQLAGSWLNVNYGYNGTIGGKFFIGARNSGTSQYNLSGQVWACCCTTLLVNDDIPTTDEIGMFARDPMRWLQDYKDGQPWRVPNLTSGSQSNFDMNSHTNSQQGGYGTKVWLMGEGVNDVYDKIKSQNSNQTNGGFLNMKNMTSSDIIDVMQIGLTN